MWLGLAGTIYPLSGVVAATDGLLKNSDAMGAAMVAKDNKIQSQSVAFYGPPSLIRPEMAGISLAVEKCPVEEDLKILTDRLSAIYLLRDIQRRYFPLLLQRHTVRHLLVQVFRRINQRSAAVRRALSLG